jgi:hypothetical protein
MTTAHIPVGDKSFHAGVRDTLPTPTAHMQTENNLGYFLKTPVLKTSDKGLDLSYTEKDENAASRDVSSICDIFLQRKSTTELKWWVEIMGNKISRNDLRQLMKRDRCKQELSRNREDFKALSSSQEETTSGLEARTSTNSVESECSSPSCSSKIGMQQTMVGAILQQVYSGGIAGAVSRTATAPIDRIKILAQTAPPGAKSTW